MLRSAEKDFVNAMEQGQDVAIVSRLGNGKTLLLQRLGLTLLAAGWAVYQSNGDSALTASECGELAKLTGKVAILFDGGIANELAIRALGLERSRNLRIAFTERSSRFDTRISDDWLTGCGIEILFEHRLDTLDDDESDALVDLLNSTGLWGYRSALDPLAKKSFITRDCRSELASVMLHIVKSADITARVKQSLASENLSSRERSFLILATAISVTSGEINTTTLARLSSHSSLNEFARRGSDFRSHLYSIRGINFSLNSSLFGTFFLRDLVSAQEVLEVVAQAVQRAIKNGIGFKPRKYQDDDSYYGNDFPSSLYVFRNLQLLVDTAKNIDAISWFYEEIRRGTNLEEDPLYWLHYAISKFFAQDSVRAKVYLDNAYGVARRTPGFLTFQIDNQYARLLLV